MAPSNALPPLDARLRPAHAIASRVMGDTALLLHPRADEVKLTNEVGTLVWRLVGQGGHTARTIAAAVVEAFEVDGATAEADVLAFLGELATGGFLAWDPQPEP